MQRRRNNRSAARLLPWIAAGAGALGAAALGLAAGWIAYSGANVNHNLRLPSAIGGLRREFTGKAGRLSFYSDEQHGGTPLVLIHSINAGGSAYEMLPLFEHYRGSRPVYALDLPGFGYSDRSDRAYSPELYTQAILDLLVQQVGPAADVVALSLSAEFAAMAALQRPEQFRSLILISPTGFSRKSQQRPVQQAGARGGSDGAYQVLAFPLWSQPFYDLLVTRPSLRYFLQMSFAGPVNEEMIDYAYLTTHQPGARYAPLYFVSGKLFTPGVRERVYAQVKTPTLVLYDRDPFTGFEMLPGFAAAHENWRAERIENTRGLPHFERRNHTAQVMERFWRESVPELIA